MLEEQRGPVAALRELLQQKRGGLLSVQSRRADEKSKTWL